MNKEPKQESEGFEKNLNQVIKIDQARIKSHLGEMVRETVEETLNVMLDTEADQLCQARSAAYARSSGTCQLLSLPSARVIFCPFLQRVSSFFSSFGINSLKSNS